MVGTPAATAAPGTLDAVASRDVGAVFLSGRSRVGVSATASVVRTLVAANRGQIPLIVATDQEGGEVQVLSGPGFDAIPSAVDQGRLAPAALRTDAARWGAQLATAGVNLDLAPVADVVSGSDSVNEPIALLQREYGFDASSVVAHAGAFADGLRDAGVTSTFKHFPGLGYVVGNTDTEAGVTDDVTGTAGPTVRGFESLVAARPAVIMVSSAIYSKIDAAGPAVFSSTVVTGLLRSRLGFGGIIATDDLSGAKQVQQWPSATRGVLAIEAGADLVLVTKFPDQAPAMIDAVVAKAKSDPAFAQLVDAGATRVVQQKRALGIHN
jgi:beta-N-acetylhexosaminidase